jgi:hypothetical protein
MNIRSVLPILAAAALLSSCSIQKRSLMPGWHFERVSPSRAEQTVSPDAFVVGPDEIWAGVEEGIELDFSTERADLDVALVATKRPQHEKHVKPVPLSVPSKVEPVARQKKLLRTTTADTTIQLDRDAELTLTFIGAALLMSGYMPFSIIGFLVVFLASIVGAPLVHAIIWGEKMDWGQTRLGRIALSLVLSGLVLTGAVALVADILGLVF